MNARSYHTLSPSLIPNPFGFIKHTPYNYLGRDKISRYDNAFAIVRNPWSRMVSMYHHGIYISENAKKTWYHQDKISWDEFISRMDSFRMNPSYYWNHPFDQWASQMDWVTKNYKVKCDILRYEHIQEDINSYFGENIELKKENIGVYKKHYSEYYTEEQKQKIADWFRLEIEYWGFTFESGATKNYWIKDV